jgi:mRNA interferase RelE/StbE
LTYSIDWEPPAVAAASRYLKDDPARLPRSSPASTSSPTTLARTIRSPSAHPTFDVYASGGTEPLYEITDATIEILITHIGRSG